MNHNSSETRSSKSQGQNIAMPQHDSHVAHLVVVIAARNVHQRPKERKRKERNKSARTHKDECMCLVCIDWCSCLVLLLGACALFAGFGWWFHHRRTEPLEQWVFEFTCLVWSDQEAALGLWLFAIMLKRRAVKQEKTLVFCGAYGGTVPLNWGVRHVEQLLLLRLGRLHHGWHLLWLLCLWQCLHHRLVLHLLVLRSHLFHFLVVRQPPFDHTNELSLFPCSLFV